MSDKKGHLFIISAPSGAGKSTIINEVRKTRPDMFFSISATTRAPRTGETNGVEYHFLTKDEFENMISEDKLLEYAEYVGNFYGTPEEPIRSSIENGTDVILEIEVQGHRQVKGRIPEAISIFIAPPNMEELERRLRDRGTDSEEKISARLKTAEKEMTESGNYDYVVVNDTVERATNEILSIMRS